MSERTDANPTRRGVIKGGSAMLAGGMLAGCTGNGAQSGVNNSSSTDSTTSNGGSYTVGMAPMGDVSFEGAPESLFVVFSQYADMAVALGHGDAVNAIYSPELSGDIMGSYCARLDGVSPGWKELPDPLADGLSKEKLYELDSDVHFLDPAYVSTQQNWKQADIDEIATNVGPWFGNFYSGTHDEPPKSYRDSYQYYSLWDLFGKVARVLQERDRYRKLERMHSNVLSTIRSKLPPKGERPTAVRVTLNDDNSAFYTYHLNRPGYWLADTRPLGARDAFAEKDWSSLWGEVGYEAMLEADPDVILHLWSMSSKHDLSDVRKRITNKPAGRDLAAVRNDRVYPAGMRYQGPIMNLFQLEMTAKQLYPERFGEWPDYTSGDPYPEIPADERLFDRQKLAAIIDGTA
ncbi:ferrichrome-binding protein [Halococcus morrhuae DSM 1307]|uniref:Ferrichrome-binding protein n=1 Tax=Halococcus morrhuae DSM 1307 TaxID=931277 RepID=M0N4Q6_HALMO|nr:ABC transporter substrate-binding protein [Halococcus morrhuae]EMA51675.1 ferrichrome-binding protein [Halococcus morrhuae DSM 1307]